MITISVEELHRDVLGYLERVEGGDTVVVVQGGKAVAELKPATAGIRELRPFGLCAGEFQVPDDFDAPLPNEIVRQFEGL
jgi:antitoxin (DNA-binding transcriptional repressor) of toxin-antitoxin stability system